MKPKKNFRNRILAIALALATVFTAAPFSNVFQPVAAYAASSEQQTGLAENVQDGTILHCWCWSFNTIKENIPAIAAAGFTSIQTSPANAVNDSHPNLKIMGWDEQNGTDGCWWWHYQPTDWKIGNYQLGTREEFKAMCEEADKYGVNVIVDVVPNHTTPDEYLVSQEMYNAAGGYDRFYHDWGHTSISNWNDRKWVISGGLLDLRDIDTENPGYQAYFLNYLNDLIDCGADGFRYDTAKHIGLPSDPMDDKSQRNGERNNFWPVVTGQESANGVSIKNPEKLFQYGEVLQGENTPEREYANYIRLTASSYGRALRDAAKNNNFSTNNLVGMQHAAPNDRLVTWVESHDTYCNEGESVDLNDTQIRLAWAVIAARGEGTPLFFNRPDGSNGWNNRWGNNVIGPKGNDQFMHPEVVAVNFFRNAMAGNPEYMRNPNGNTQILQIDRGADGTCIINAGWETDLNGVETTMADGTYTDQVSGRTFTVSGGKLSGHLDGQKVAVIYNATNEKLNAVTVKGGTSFSTETVDVTLVAKNVTNTSYSTSEGAEGTFADGDVITIGAGIKEGGTVTVTLNAVGENGAITKTFTFKKIGRNIAYLQLPGGWYNPYCYAYSEAGGSNAEWPGVPMTDLGNGLYSYEVPDSITNPRVIFYGGDNSHRYPYDGQPGLVLEGAYIYENSNWHEYNPVDPNPDPEPEPVNVPEITSLTASTPDKAVLGTTIKFTAAAEGGEGELLYKFYRVQNGVTTVFRDFAKSNVAYCNPSAGGDYTVSVEVKDEAGNTATESMPYTWEVPVVELKVTNLSASAASGQPLGTTVKFTAATEGGNGALQYRFYRVQNGVTTVFRDFDKSNVAYCNPPKGGSYAVWVEVKDADGNTAKKELEFKWENNEEQLSIKAFKVSQESPVAQGITVKFTVAAKGGEGDLQYRFYRVMDGTTTVFRDYASSNVAYCNPPKAGSYTIYVDVKDSTGKVVTEQMAYEWK